MRKFILIPVAAMTLFSPAALLSSGGAEHRLAAPGEEIDLAVRHAERELERAQATRHGQ